MGQYHENCIAYLATSNRYKNKFGSKCRICETRATYVKTCASSDKQDQNQNFSKNLLAVRGAKGKHFKSAAENQSLNKDGEYNQIEGKDDNIRKKKYPDFSSSSDTIKFKEPDIKGSMRTLFSVRQSDFEKSESVQNSRAKFPDARVFSDVEKFNVRRSTKTSYVEILKKQGIDDGGNINLNEINKQRINEIDENRSKLSRYSGEKSNAQNNVAEQDKNRDNKEISENKSKLSRYSGEKSNAQNNVAEQDKNNVMERDKNNLAEPDKNNLAERDKNNKEIDENRSKSSGEKFNDQNYAMEQENYRSPDKKNISTKESKTIINDNINELSNKGQQDLPKNTDDPLSSVNEKGASRYERTPLDTLNLQDNKIEESRANARRQQDKPADYIYSSDQFTKLDERQLGQTRLESQLESQLEEAVTEQSFSANNSDILNVDYLQVTDNRDMRKKDKNFEKDEVSQLYARDDRDMKKYDKNKLQKVECELSEKVEDKSKKEVSMDVREEKTGNSTCLNCNFYASPNYCNILQINCCKDSDAIIINEVFKSFKIGKDCNNIDENKKCQGDTDTLRNKISNSENYNNNNNNNNDESKSLQFNQKTKTDDNKDQGCIGEVNNENIKADYDTCDDSISEEIELINMENPDTSSKSKKEEFQQKCVEPTEKICENIQKQNTCCKGNKTSCTDFAKNISCVKDDYLDKCISVFNALKDMKTALTQNVCEITNRFTRQKSCNNDEKDGNECLIKVTNVLALGRRCLLIHWRSCSNLFLSYEISIDGCLASQVDSDAHCVSDIICGFDTACPHLICVTGISGNRFSKRKYLGRNNMKPSIGDDLGTSCFYAYQPC